jgi:hypothetical protein
MAAKIVVLKLDEGKFQVRVAEGASQSTHQVTISGEYYRQLTGGKHSEEALLERSFEFLLERESMESILPRFDLREIGRYFPSYERIIKDKLASI